MDKEIYLAEFVLVHKSQVRENYNNFEPLPSTASTDKKYQLIRAKDLEEAKETAFRFYTGKFCQEWQSWYLFYLEVTEPYELK